MKKAAALMLCLCLFLAGCGLFPKQDMMTMSGQSLWDKTFSVDKVPVPQEAFAAGGAKRCFGMAPDGVTFLMIDCAIPYLYNTRTHTKMTLVPADLRIADMVRAWLLRRAGELTAQEAADLEERVAALKGEELTGELCTREGKANGPRAVIGYSCDGNYMIAYTMDSMPMVIDCGTGAYYIWEDAMPLGVRDGKVLLQMPAPSATVRTEDLKTGAVTEDYFSFVGGFESGAALKAAAFLPDGSLCVVLRDLKQDLKHGEACVLAVRNADKEDEVYPLGNIFFGKEPELIFSADSQRIIISSRSAARVRCPYLIDRTTGSVSLLVCRDCRVESIPLKDVQAEDGQVPDADKMGEDSMIPLDAMSDGETVLVWGTGQGEMLLYRPATGETRGLVPDEYNGFPAPVTFCGNHYDRFWMNSWNDFTDYTQLTIREK